MERELGKGAMGVVFLGRDPVIGRRVALKTIRATAEDDSEQREFNQRFLREAQAAGTLSHPNIVTIHDVGEEVETQTSFIAMEYVEGKNLKQLLKDKVSFSWDRIAEIAMAVADALDYAHRRGIVHRDVKPANIILTNDGTVKITDFGIAKIEASSLTETGQFLGTPNYMSPEQVTGEPVDGRSDLFSLGVVLYELLTKRKPFIGDNLTSISYKIVHEEFPAPQTYDASIPAEMNAILHRALAKDPAARFQSGRDFHSTLAEFRARHAEMEILRDLGEMVAQAEKLGPVSAIESQNAPLPASAPEGPAAAPRPPVPGATSLQDLARRGRSDLNPALVGPAPTNLDTGVPDWSLDTDALKSPAAREAEKKREVDRSESLPSSPGTLISDVVRGLKKPAPPPPPPAPTQIFNEENRPTERIQTIPSPAAAAPPETTKISTGEIKRPLGPGSTSPEAIPTPPRGVPPLPPASRDSAPPTPPRGTAPLAPAPSPPTPAGGVPPIGLTSAPTVVRPLPPPGSAAPPAVPPGAGAAPPIRPPTPPRETITGPIQEPRPGGAPAIRDVSAPIAQQPAQQRPGGRPGLSSAPTRAGGRDITGPVTPVKQATGPVPAVAPEARPQSLREALQWQVNKRYALMVVGGALLIALIVIGALVQRSRSIAGRTADETAAKDTLAKRKLLEDGTRLLAAGDPAGARARFLELVRLAPDSSAARLALQQSEQILAKKLDDERKASEVGAYLAEARRARMAADWARVVVESEGALGVDPTNFEAKELRDTAQSEIKKQGRSGQKKAETQMRTLRASPRAKPTAAPAPTAVAAAEPTAAPPVTAPVPAAGQRVRLRIHFRAPISEGYVMVRRNDVEIWRRAFDFGRRAGGGTIDGEVEIASGAGEFKAWVIATDRSVNEYQVVPLTVGEGRTLNLDVDPQRKLSVSLR